MGSYETEQQLIAQGKAKRGQTALEYFEEMNQGTLGQAFTRRPDYSDSLFAERNDDIYREFCRYIDQPKPRFYDRVENPMSVNGYTAADIYKAMKGSNYKLVDVDAAAVYDMMVTLREEPELAERILHFHPTCYKSGMCG